MKGNHRLLLALWLVATAALLPLQAGGLELVTAKIGGNTSPDGAEIQIDLPIARHLRNKGGNDKTRDNPRGEPGKGYGLCVFTSNEMSADYAGLTQLQGFRDWMTNYPGGGIPSKLTEKIREYCALKKVPIPDYIQVEGADLEILRLALKTGRMPSVTYNWSPTNRYPGIVLRHMVNCVHGDGDTWAILDNNNPGKYEWMNTKEMSRAYAPGWAVIYLASGPPPAPKNSRPAKLHTQKLLAGEWRGPLPGGWLTLWHGGAQLGAWREDQGYRPLLAENQWGRTGWSPWPPPVADAPPRWIPEYFDQGVTLDGLGRTPRYEHNGKECSREHVMDQLKKTALVDDSAKLRLTVIGPPEDCQRVLSEVQALAPLSWAKRNYTVRDYRPSDWQVADVGFVCTGKPSIYLQRPDGEVLFRMDKYPGAAALAEAIRKKDTNYDPAKDPDGAPPAPPPPPVKPPVEDPVKPPPSQPLKQPDKTKPPADPAAETTIPGWAVWLTAGLSLLGANYWRKP